MASTGWEQVGKQKKAKDKGSAPSTKGEKKSFIDTMPRIEPKAPVKESETIYDVLKAKEPPSTARLSANGDASTMKPSGIPKLKKQISGEASKPVKSVEKKQPVTPEDVSKQLTRIEFETLLAKTTSIFPDSPHLWLKDMAGHLNAKFESVEESSDPVFEKMPDEYPVCLLPKAVTSFFVSTMSKCQEDVLQLFLDHCIQTAMSEQSKGVPVYGYRMVVQILASKHAAIFTSSLQKHLEMILSHKSHVVRCLTALWCLGQAGVYNASAGVRVWLDVMLPLLGIKSFAPYAITYLERLLDRHRDLNGLTSGDGGSLVSPTHFFVIFDGVFNVSGSSPLAPPLHKRLQALYPQLKILAFGSTHDDTLRKFFKSFIVRLPACKQANQLDEVMSCVIACLQQDRESYALWTHMYRQSVSEHSQASSLIIKHILANWDSLCHIGGQPDLLRDTVSTFVAINEERGREVGNEAARQQLSECDQLCKTVLAKFESADATAAAQSYLMLFVTVFVVLTSLVGFDLYQHGGFKGSKCEYLLQESHILCAYSSLVEFLARICANAEDFARRYLPVLVKQTQDVTEQFLWSSYILVEELSRPSRTWLQDNVPVFLDWVVSHPAWSALSNAVVQGWSWLSNTVSNWYLSVSRSIQ